MRPVNNAPQPRDAQGNAIQYSKYQDWRNALVNAYENHCVFCNGILPYRLEVEHQSPQSAGQVNPLNWDNLKLACPPCNRSKSAQILRPSTHYLPNVHNTHLAFVYQERRHRKLTGKMACIPIPNPDLSEVQQKKAARTIDALKLNRVERGSVATDRKMTDIRWLNRYTASQLAARSRALWDSLVTTVQKNAFIPTVATQLRTSGFFSIWYLAFADVPQVLRALVNELNNTADAFPAPNHLPITRTPDDL